MRFTEIDLFGVYVAPISLMMVGAWVTYLPLRYLADRLGLLRQAWHPALFSLSVYIVLLSILVLVSAS
jgi:hypothetical protein